MGFHCNQLLGSKLSGVTNEVCKHVVYLDLYSRQGSYSLFQVIVHSNLLLIKIQIKKTPSTL